MKNELFRTTKRKLLIIGVLVLGFSLIVRQYRAPLLAPEQFSRAVYDRRGALLRLTLSPSQTYRVFTPLEDISPQLIDATLDYEDRHFYRHLGVNPVALIKAFNHTYITAVGRRGGSTITMQLARIRWGAPSRSPWGKLVQVAHAIELEWLYSKHDILEAYLNLAPYGGNVEGVGAASLIYFHRSANEMSLPEAMALAVLPQSPTRRMPDGLVEPVALYKARLKLAAMSLERHPTMKADSLALDAPLAVFTVKQLPFLAPHAVSRALSSRAGQALRLTLEHSLQTQFERLVTRYVARRAADGLTNAAALLVDVETGEVLAHVGSADFFSVAIDGQIDGVTVSRSPGSALKPLVYARALDEGLIHPKTLLKDVPMRFGSYNPENFDSQYLGPMSATEALMRSRNVPAVELNLRLVHGLHDVLREGGIKGLRSADHYGAGIVLGGVELSMEELVSLYVALAHGGTWSALRRVVGEPQGTSHRMVSPEAAELTLQMLSTDETGLEQWATTRDAVKVAWKTGTSHGFRDAWTVGVVGRYALAVWVGNFDGQPNPSFVGRTAAGPLFFELVGALREKVQTPQGHRTVATVDVVDAEVCAVSGKRPGPFCAHLTHTRVIPGRSPIELCEVHRLVHLDVRTGLRRCHATPGLTRDEVFEFWPSDISLLFARAGFGRRPVPAFAEPCDVDDSLTRTARIPHIMSPQSAMTYHLRRDSPSQSHVPLLAHADGSAHVLTWFAGAERIGTVAPGESLEWSAPSGEYQLRAVDEHGNAAQVTVTIRWAESPVH